MKKLFICFPALLLLFSCGSETTNNSQQESIKRENEFQARQDSISKAFKESAKKYNADSLSDDDKRFQEITPAEVQQKLIALKKNFILEKDEFSSYKWYTHKNQTINNSYNRKYLSLDVSEDGSADFKSHYYSDSWLFHKKVRVKIGQDVYYTDEVTGDNNRTNNSSGSIWELVTYNGMRDHDIPKFIAESGTKPIKVRFEGDEKTADIMLSDRDRKAIKDAWELSRLLKIGK